MSTLTQTTQGHSDILSLPRSPQAVLPEMLCSAPEGTQKRFIEFFLVTIRNENTRAAYYRACSKFFEWCDKSGIRNLEQIEPLHIAAYIETLCRTLERSSVKQHLAAIRMLYDWFVVGHVVPANPAASVRGPKLVLLRGKTPALEPFDARRLLDCIEISNVIGLRDRALIALMIFSFARVSAAISMRVGDYFFSGRQRWIRLREKGGIQHQMPAHHLLQNYLDEYIAAAGLRDKSAPLYPTRRGEILIMERAMSRMEAYRMVRSRGNIARLAIDVCCHTFRATGITAYLSNGGTLENAQRMAAHRNPRTTKLYDRTEDRISEEEVERIAI